MDRGNSLKLKEIWNNFLQTPNLPFNEKYKWLDLFACELLVRYQDESIINIFKCWPIDEANLVSLISCQLLEIVHHVCTTPHDEETSRTLKPLQNLFFNDGAWRLLKVLHILSLEGISCARELFNLLITIYPISYMKRNENVRTNKNHLLKSTPTNLNDLIVELMRCKQKSKVRKPPKPHDLHARPRRNRRRSYKFSDDMSESEIEPTISYNSKTKPQKDTPESPTLTYEDYLSDEHEKLMAMNVTNYELSTLIIQLLDKICEIQCSSDECVLIAVQSVKFSSDCLSALQKNRLDNDVTGDETVQMQLLLVQLLLRAIAKASDSVQAMGGLLNNKMFGNLLQLIQDMLGYKKSYLSPCQEDEASKPTTNQTHTKVIYGIACAVNLILINQLNQTTNSTTFKQLSTTFDLFRLLVDAQHGHFFDNVISIISTSSNPVEIERIDQINRLVDFLGRYIVCLKRMRTEIMHRDECNAATTSKHARQCKQDILLNLHHHVDYLGGSFNNPVENGASYKTNNNKSSSSCLVSSLFMTLMKLLGNAHVGKMVDVQIRLLKIMNLCGTCCCFPTKHLLSTIINLLRTNYRSRVRKLSFSLLERTFFHELGAIIPPAYKNQCALCNKIFFKSEQKDDEKNVTNKVGNITPNLSYTEINYAIKKTIRRRDFEFFDTDVSERVDFDIPQIAHNPSYSSTWKFINQYNVLINSSDVKLSNLALHHLLRVASKCTDRVKYELLFRVFYPVFLITKEKYFDNRDNNDTDDVAIHDVKSENIKFKLHLCLSLFTSFLNNPTFTEQFVTIEGLTHIFDLINNVEFSKACCSVLEITIIIEILRLDEESFIRNKNENDDFEENVIAECLPSLNMLNNAIINATKDLINLFTDQKNVTLYESARGESVSITESLNSLPDVVVENTPKTSAFSLLYEERKMDASDNHCLHTDDYMQLLQNCTTFWRAFSDLCLFSPKIRHFMKTNSIFELDKQALQTILSKLLSCHESCENECANQERQLLLKFFESLLTVQLVSKVDIISIEQTLRKIILEENMNRLSYMRHIEICDILLKSSVLKVSADEKIPKQLKPKQLTANEPSYWNDAAVFGLDFETNSNDDAHMEIAADEGYDADIELLDYVDQSSVKVDTVGDETSSDTDSQTCVLPSIGSITAYHEHNRSNFIVYPSMCVLFVELLLKLHEKDGDVGVKELVTSLQKLVLLCRKNPHNCVVLSHANIIYLLLNGFHKYLVSSNVQDEELAHVILDLFAMLANHSITRDELSSYLSLFKADNPPLRLMLTPLLQLATGCQMQPNYILCFPSIKYINHYASNQNNDPTLKYPMNMHTQHQGILNSAWANFAVCLPLSTQIGWNMWSNGFSYCFWFRHEHPGAVYAPTKKLYSSATFEISSDNSKQTSGSNPTTPKPNKLMHVISVGQDNLMVEMWIDARQDSLIFRLTKPEYKGNKILNEVKVHEVVSSSQWHFMVVNVTQRPVKSNKTEVLVNLIIDGWREITTKLQINTTISDKLRASHVLLGHIRDSDDAKNSMGSWFLGNLMVFRQKVFTKETSIYMVSLGPNYTSLTECDVGVTRVMENFVSSRLGPRTASNMLDWDNILDTSYTNLKDLQENLLLSYSSQNANVVNVYPQVVSNAGSVMSNLFTNQAAFRVVNSDIRASQQLPLTVTPGLTVPLIPQHYQGLVTASLLLGGSSVFLFFFARIAELKSTSAEQGMAMKVLLSLVQSDNVLYTQFCKQNGHQLLLHVLSTRRCEGTYHILRAFIDVACDKSIFSVTSSNKVNKISVLVQNDAIIVNASLVKLAVQAWHVWKAETLDLLFIVLNSLLRDEHPFREFNAAQLNRVHMVDTVLNFCKEKFLYFDDEQSNDLSLSTCSSIVELIRSLMGAPPEFCHIVTIADFLLLLHQASSTYVTHSRSSFYFILNESFPPGVNSKNPLSLLRGLSVSMTEETPVLNPRKLSRALKHLKIQQRQVRKVRKSNPIGQGVEKSQSETYTSSDSDSGDTKDAKSTKSTHSSKTITSSTADISPHSQNSVSDVEEIDYVFVDKYNEFVQDSLDDFRKLKFDGIFTRKPSQANNLGGTAPGDSGKMADFKAKSSTRSSESIDKNIKSEWLIVERLLLVLKDTLLMLPDTMANQVLTGVVKMDVLLVLVNHPSDDVRAALVKAISAHMQRSTEEDRLKLYKSKYFYHLASQLGLYSASPRLVNACVSLITKSDQPIDEQTQNLTWASVSNLQIETLPPLLALLPRSLNDIDLTRKIIAFISDLFLIVNPFKTLLDMGLVESVLKTLYDACQLDNYEAVYSDLTVFLIGICSKSLLFTGAQNVQIVDEIHAQLNYLVLREESDNLKNETERYLLREAQCTVLDGQLDTLQERLNCFDSPNLRLRTTTSYLVSGKTRKISEGGSLKYRNNSAPGGTFGQLFDNITSSKENRDLPKSELYSRFKATLIKCVEFFLNLDPRENISLTEVKLVKRVLSFLVQGLATAPKPNDGIMWHTAIWGARSALRRPAACLLCWFLAPEQNIKLRMFAIHALCEEVHCKDLLNFLLQTHPQLEQKFTVYLWELMYKGVHENAQDDFVANNLSGSEFSVCETFKDMLCDWGIISPFHVGKEYDFWKEEVKTLMLETKREKQRLINQNIKIIYKSIYKWETTWRNLMDNAMTITRSIVELQNNERKSFIVHMKQLYSEKLNARTRWQHIVQQLTHEQAVWFFPELYPQSWQLDATEGPLRVRKRLQRCHLDIQARFYYPERVKTNSNEHCSPLSYLFDYKEDAPTESSLTIERLHTSEKIKFMTQAAVITPAVELTGELLMGECCLHFVPDDTSKFPAQLLNLANGSNVTYMAWQYENIREIHNRRYELQERGVEIFLTNGRTYLVAFTSLADRDNFVSMLSQCHLPNRVQPTNHLNDIVQSWRDNIITNWEYVMQLNKIAGRSYNDLMQYPVFPFVLADYLSDELDLSDGAIYRNFRKPMAVQNKKNEKHYINNYNYLQQAVLESSSSLALNQAPYHYGSHYSNSGTVLHFLVRLPPFTQMFLTYQDNNFDIPDRTFHALHTTWRLTSCDSTTDVKELIPEFFYLPEFLENNEGFNFGTRQNNEPVHDVILPAWCAKNARIFTLVHRQILESDYVRENLPHWIDLVFGFKQTGKAAVDAINVFHPATYYGFDLDKFEDPVERTAWETMIRTYGQTPRQLFKSPHPMIVQPLVNALILSKQTVLDGIKGIRWGSYVGSPELPPAIVAWRHQYPSPIVSIIPLITNDVFGLPLHTVVLLRYNKEKGTNLNNTVMGVAYITWAHSDNILRVKLKKDQPPSSLLQAPGYDTMCACTSVPDLPQLWIGYASGLLNVYSYHFQPDRAHLELKSDPVVLQGHKEPITALALCSAFSIAISGSQDATAILWDLNLLTYVRAVRTSDALPVSLISISETMGDFCVVSNHNGTGSVMDVFTINCRAIGVVRTSERITAVCYSNAPEGVSVNVIATGLQTGVIRLWSSWNLKAVRDIHCTFITRPIISLCYSQDYQHLFVCASDGKVVIWENTTWPGKTPKFLNYASL